MHLSNSSFVNPAYWIAVLTTALFVSLSVFLTQAVAADKNQLDFIVDAESEDDTVSVVSPNSVQNSSAFKFDREDDAEALDETGTDSSNKLHLFMSEQEQYDAQQTQAAQHILQRVQSSDSCLLYTSPSPRDKRQSRMPSSA